jgi:hypothetical protein
MHSFAHWCKLITHRTIQWCFLAHPIKVRRYTCDGARLLSQVLRWWAHHIIRLWVGRLATSSSQCRTAGPDAGLAFLCRCLALDRPNTSDLLVIFMDLFSYARLDHAQLKFSYHLIKSILVYLPQRFFNLQTITFFHIKAACSSLIVLSLGWSKGSRHYQSISLLGWPLLLRGNSASPIFQGLEVLSIQDPLRCSTQEGVGWCHHQVSA